MGPRVSYRGLRASLRLRRDSQRVIFPVRKSVIPFIPHFGHLLQDQYDNIAKHTEKGIDFCEYYSRFIKERSDCELAYAKSLR